MAGENNQPHHFTFTIAVLFTLNYIMGTGFLTIPWAFHRSGVILGTFILAIIIFPSVIGALFILETMARAEALSLNSISRTVNRKGYNSISTNDSETISNPIQSSNWIVGNRKYEISELCEIFLGTNGLRLFSLTVAIYLYGSLWAYTTVFANSLNTLLSLGEYSYYIYTFIFAAIVIPTSCYDLSEQITLQMIYSACRVVMVVLMLSTVIGAYLSTGTTYSEKTSPTFAPTSTPIINPIYNNNNDIDNGFSDINNSTIENNYLDNDSITQRYLFEDNNSYLWNLNGLHIILPISLFAYIFHHSIPALSEPVIEKKHLSHIFILTLFCCFVAYSLIGIVLSLYFGDHIHASSNINWNDYDGGVIFENWSPTLRSIIVTSISSFVIFFPAVDVSSAFPLCAITLGNNLLSTFSPTDQFNHQTVIYYRLLAAIPPILGGMFVKDLGIITNFTGLTGFILVFIFPTLLAYHSKKLLDSKHISTNTHYSSFLTSDIFVWGLFLFGIFVITFVSYSNIIELLSNSNK